MPLLLPTIGLILLQLFASEQAPSPNDRGISAARKWDKPPHGAPPVVAVSETELRRVHAATRRMLRERGLADGRHSFRVADVQRISADSDRWLHFEHLYAGVPVEDGGLTVHLADDGRPAVHDEGVVWAIRVATRPRRTPARVLAEHGFAASGQQGERGSEALALVILPQPVVREATVVDGVLIEPDPALPPKLRPRLAYKLSTFRRRDGAVVQVTLWVDAHSGEVLRTFEQTPFRCGLPDPLGSP